LIGSKRFYLHGPFTAALFSSWWLLLGLCTFLNSCIKPTVTLFSEQPNCGISFRNTVTDKEKDNTILYRNFYNGGGVAIGDLNNDGLPEVLLTSNMGTNKLFQNLGGFKFKDISGPAGLKQDNMWSTGVVMADINGDGWLDIYICNSGHMSDGNRRNKLYINNHNMTFTECAAKYKLDISGYTTQVSFFDYDGDGDLDCFMINNSPIPINQLNFANRRNVPDSAWNIPKNMRGGGDHLYRNDNGVFKEVTRAAGIHGGLISFGLGVSVGDINNDGWPDIFVSNDSYERDYLYINQQNGTFKDEMTDWFQHTSFSSMGADIADINNDGFSDLFTTDMLPSDENRLKTMGSFDNISLFNAKLRSGFYYQYPKNCLQLNNQNGKFMDIARYSGVAATDWSWGALMFDMDNDGWNDLLVCNGVNRDVTDLDFMDFFANDVLQEMRLSGKKYAVDKILKQIPRTPIPKKVFKNEGNLKFSEVAADWGLDQPRFSNGAAYGDLDGDGDLDLIVNNENDECSVYRNNAEKATKNNFLAVKLRGTGMNSFAIGSKVRLYSAGTILTRELYPSRGFQSSVDYKLVFGLGHRAKIDSIEVIWPDRRRTVYPPPKNLNGTLHLKEPLGVFQVKPIVTRQAMRMFVNVPASFQKHSEDDYEDFYAERGIPRILSKEGPKAAIADINNDGLKDIYIGGSKGHQGQLYIQSSDGSFLPKSEKAFAPFAGFEDTAVLFFDCDGDGDPDLLICGGSNTMPLEMRELQLRLFRNDGKGNFTLDAGAFPNIYTNISVALAHDVNHDGSLDLFIGSRSVPGNYGANPESYLFTNDGKGHFSKIQSALFPQLANLGMVTSAVWANILGTKEAQLIVVGEWMPPKVFAVRSGRFFPVSTSLDKMSGWWQTVAAGDLDGDGRTDLVLGNIGENFYLHPDALHPVKLWLNDFDKNGETDKIITYTVGNKDLPVNLKHDLEDQLPGIKKQNFKHHEYASKSIQDLFPADVISSSQVKLFNYMSSCTAFNKGGGRFDIETLSPMVQMSCVNAVLIQDVNQDGKPDLVLGGNQFGFLPQFERLDASFGDVLLNNGKRSFTWLASSKSGLSLRGEMRDIKCFDTGAGKRFLFLQNSDYPQLFKLSAPTLSTVHH